MSWPRTLPSTSSSVRRFLGAGALAIGVSVVTVACSGGTRSAETEQPAARPPALETRLNGEVVFEMEYVDDEYGRLWVDGTGHPPEIIDGELFIEARDNRLRRFDLRLDADSGELLAIAVHNRDVETRCGVWNRHLELRHETDVVVARDPWTDETLWTRPAGPRCAYAVDDVGQVWEQADGELRRLRPDDGSVMWSAPLPELATLSNDGWLRNWLLFPSADAPQRVIVQGHSELAAFDSETGLQSWSRPIERLPRCDFRRSAQTVWAVPSRGGVVVIDAATGEERWRREESGMRVLYVSDQIVLVTDGNATFECGSSWSRDGSVTALRATDGSVAWNIDVPTHGALDFLTSAQSLEPDPLGRGVMLRVASFDFDADDQATSIEWTWIDEASGVPVREPELVDVAEMFTGAPILTREPGLTYSIEGGITSFSLDGIEFHTRTAQPEPITFVLDEYVLITGLQVTAIR